jgi:glycosyltransferase involved in cell wall biosynthesis
LWPGATEYQFGVSRLYNQVRPKGSGPYDPEKGAGRNGAGAPPLIIASIFRPEGDTGVHTHIAEFRDFLSRRGIPSTLVTPFSLTPLFVMPVFGVRVALRYVSGSASVFWHRHFHELFLRRALRIRLQSLDEAVIYVQGPLEAHAALRARTSRRQRVIMAIHFQRTEAEEWARNGTIRSGGSAYRSIQELEKSVAPQVDGIVFVSRAAQSDFLSWLPEVAAVPSAVIPNFVKPLPRVAQKQLGDLVTIGRVEIAKNQRFLLQVLVEARRMGSSLSLDIFGDGSYRKVLERLASSLDLTEQVRFRGFRRDVRELLPAYRVYVHSSLSEALPMAIIEAMAAGLPTVATSAGGVPEICRDGIEGRLSPPDPRATATVLLDFIGDEKQRSAAGVASFRRYEEHFHVDVVAPLLYDFLLHCPAPPSARPKEGEFPVVNKSPRSDALDPLALETTTPAPLRWKA